MPPSGYNSEQAEAIVAFLSSCAQALRSEASDRGETTDQALLREQRQIAAGLGESQFDAFERAVLELSKSFYALMSSQQSTGKVEFDELISKATAIATKKVLAIKL